MIVEPVAGTSAALERICARCKKPFQSWRSFPVPYCSKACADGLDLSRPLRPNPPPAAAPRAGVRVKVGAYASSQLRLVLDTFLLALLYDMCVQGVPYRREPSAQGASTNRLPSNRPRGTEPRILRARTDVYSPNRDRVPGVGQSTETHATPALHEVTWFTRRLPDGCEASDEARAHAREYGIPLRRGETFVLPHKRGIGSEYLYYGGREMRSTHAVAQFEHAFWD